MIMVLGAEQFHQHGWEWAALTVAANTLLSLLLALTINKLLPGRHYPAQHAPLQPARRSGDLAAADIEWALSQMDGVIDVSEEGLLEIYRLATEHAHPRQTH